MLSATSDKTAVYAEARAFGRSARDGRWNVIEPVVGGEAARGYSIGIEFRSVRFVFIASALEPRN